MIQKIVKVFHIFTVTDFFCNLTIEIFQKKAKINDISPKMDILLPRILIKE